MQERFNILWIAEEHARRFLMSWPGSCLLQFLTLYQTRFVIWVSCLGTGFWWQMGMGMRSMSLNLWPFLMCNPLTSKTWNKQAFAISNAAFFMENGNTLTLIRYCNYLSLFFNYYYYMNKSHTESNRIEKLLVISVINLHIIKMRMAFGPNGSWFLLVSVLNILLAFSYSNCYSHRIVRKSASAPHRFRFGLLRLCHLGLFFHALSLHYLFETLEV